MNNFSTARVKRHSQKFVDNNISSKTRLCTRHGLKLYIFP
jgi:hypothetical protein